MASLNKYFDSIGPAGSRERLKAIARAGLGLRSEAAARVLKKRARRRFLVLCGLSVEEAREVVRELDVT